MDEKVIRFLRILKREAKGGEKGPFHMGAKLQAE